MAGRDQSSLGQKSLGTEAADHESTNLAMKKRAKVAEEIVSLPAEEKRKRGKVATSSLSAAAQKPIKRPKVSSAKKADRAISHAEIAQRAYFFWCQRRDQGLPGDALSDWAQAEFELQQAMDQ